MWIIHRKCCPLRVSYDIMAYFTVNIQGKMLVWNSSLQWLWLGLCKREQSSDEMLCQPAKLFDPWLAVKRQVAHSIKDDNV